MSDYWKNVGSKLKSIGKSLLTVGTPIAIECGIQIAIEKACDTMTKKLNKVYVNSIRNSLITLFLNVIGMLLLYVPIFGVVVSRTISSLCFLGATSFFIYRQISFIKCNGKVCIEVGRDIIQCRSLIGGISVFINRKIPIIAYAYTGIDILSTYFLGLNQITRLEDIISYFIKIFRRQIILYVVLISIYSVFVYCFLKPILLNTNFEMSWNDLYFYPI